MTSPTRDEISAGFDSSEARVDARLASFDMSMKTGFAEMRADSEKLRAEMHKNTLDVIKWGIALTLTIILFTVSALTFVFKTIGQESSIARPSVAQADQVSRGRAQPQR